MNIQLVGISGSLRKESYNTKLLKAAQQLLPVGVELTIIFIEDLPMLNEDLEPPVMPNYPEAVVRFREAIRNAAGILIVSPEYNHSIPGGLKNAIDWASRGKDAPIIGKPASLMGATPGLWGTARMHMAFLPVFNTLKMHVVSKPEVYVAKAADKFDSSGKLIDSITSNLIAKNLEELIKLV